MACTTTLSTENTSPAHLQELLEIIDNGQQIDRSLSREERLSLCFEADEQNTFVIASKPIPYEEHLADAEVGTWEQFEDFTRSELGNARRASPVEVLTPGEIEFQRFLFQGRPMLWERFLKVDWNQNKPFAKSYLWNVVNERLRPWHEATLKPSVKALQMVMALNFRATKIIEHTKKGNIAPKGYIEKAYADLWRSENEPSRWTQLEARWYEAMEGLASSIRERTLKDFLIEIKTWWPRWKQYAEDITLRNQRNQYAATTEGILRRPDTDVMYIASDKNDDVFYYLIPKAVENAYGLENKLRIERNMRLIYLLIPPDPKGNKRHKTNELHMQTNPHLKPEEVGNSHCGTWHNDGHPYKSDPVQTFYTSSMKPIERKVFLQFYTGSLAVAHRIPDFWMGIFQRELRKEYQEVYKSLPDNVRLPVMNEGHDQIPTLVVPVTNRATDQHSDSKDWKKGMSHLLQFGQFESGGMCLPQIGCLFEGYGPDAVSGLKGSETDHFVPSWRGLWRVAVDTTCHQSVRVWSQTQREKARAQAVDNAGLEASEEKTTVEVETAVQEAEISRREHLKRKRPAESEEAEESRCRKSPKTKQ